VRAYADAAAGACPAAGTGTRQASSFAERVRLSSGSGARGAAQMNSVRPSSPPSAQAQQLRAPVEIRAVT
jgi:hypothetical protein